MAIAYLLTVILQEQQSCEQQWGYKLHFPFIVVLVIIPCTRSHLIIMHTKKSRPRARIIGTAKDIGRKGVMMMTIENCVNVSVTIA